ncbi:MAG: tetratricopeptide repeat protein [Rhodocyclaceae bacterium]|nr:tetratricopeptide repeat protein [Rhodocyclaceae bacterium]
MQRVFNLALHLATGAGLWVLLQGVVGATRWEQEDGQPSEGSLRFAVVAGVALFVANPMAVYGVGYLIQRSIVMATCFSVWSLVAVLAAARGRGLAWLAVAILLYAMAVLAKEHAVLLPLPALALYGIVRRPPARVIVGALAIGLVLVGVLGAVLASHYTGVVGQVFDERSARLVAQLDGMQPGVSDDALTLSIVNQAWLFFRYGLLWVIPNVGWMSVDLRPPFPLSMTEFPQVLGAPLYLAALALSVVAMVRYRDWRQMLGFAAFVPATLFATEFTTVWVQDPFVLYRSYLWAIGVPFLFAFPFIGIRPRITVAIAGCLVLLFAGLSFERLRTFRSDATLWRDAAAKHDADAPANAVGRGRAYMWRGNDLFVAGLFAGALEDYTRALAAGEHVGQVQYHRAAALKMLGEPEAALNALDASAAAGGDPDKPAAAAFLRAQILVEQGQPEGAIAAARQALALGLDAEEQGLALTIVAQSSARLRRHADSVEAYTALLELTPGSRSARVGRAMGLGAMGRREEAVADLDSVLAQGDGADVRFGRAMLFLADGRKGEALVEARKALAFKPGDPSLSALVAQLERQ